MNTDANLQFNTAVVQALAGLAEKVGEVVRDQRRTCLNCVFFDEATEGCQLAQGQRPPAVVIAYGCKGHVKDDVPF